MNSIKSLIKELDETYKQTIERRELWTNDRKNFLIEELNKIVKEVKYDWFVSTNENKFNHEAVYLKFGNRPSGIVEKENNSHLTYYGGCLFFSQSANGKVVIWLKLPHIENILYNDNPTKILATLEPSKLDVNTLNSYVESFLTEMIKAERRERETIGFKKE